VTETKGLDYLAKIYINKKTPLTEEYPNSKRCLC